MSKSKDAIMQREMERIAMLERQEELREDSDTILSVVEKYKQLEDYGRRTTMKVTIEITIDDDAYIPAEFMPTSAEYDNAYDYVPPLEDVLREIPVHNIFKSVGEKFVGLTVNTVGVETTMLEYYHKDPKADKRLGSVSRKESEV